MKTIKIKQLNKKKIALTFYFFELRVRLFYIFFSLIITFLTASFYSFDLIYLFVRPFFAPKNFIFTDLTEALSITIKISILYTCYLIVPFFIYHLWCFITPSLYENERKKIRFFFLFFSFLFIWGTLVIYFYFLPDISKFLYTFEIKKELLTIQLEARIFSYVNFTLYIYLSFLFFFQTPLIFSLLFVLKFLTPFKLSYYRKYYFFLFLLISAFLSPPDILTQLFLLIFFFFLFELSLWFGFIYNFIIAK